MVMTTIRRFDCFSIWRRRIAKKRCDVVVASLRYEATAWWLQKHDRQMARAFATAADILEKITDKYEQSGQDC